MCVAIPAQVERVASRVGTVVLDGHRAEVTLSLVPGVQVGDWVLVHAGYAIATLDEATARETFDLLKEAHECE
jgi:hydrogenase expression/formation protein HypC